MPIYRTTDKIIFPYILTHMYLDVKGGRHKLLDRKVASTPGLNLRICGLSKSALKYLGLYSVEW
jgi:hypothetical protein